jgi:hypothetical protein
MSKTIKRQFEKCLKTMIRVDTTENGQKCYLLPYTGNLTESKIKQLADKFAANLHPSFAPNFTLEQMQEALHSRLKNEWYTGREKNLTLSQYDHNGNWLLEGQGWFASNFPDGHFVIVD